MRDLPIDELLIWQQYLRDNGTTHDILVRGFYTIAQIQASKRIKPDQIFPHLKPPRPVNLAEKIQQTLTAIGRMNAARARRK